jgi:hypothetical protein
VQEKKSELRQAEGEIEQARAQARIAAEQNRTALMKARYDVDRATLDLADEQIVSRVERERAKLAIDDARQKLREMEEKGRADAEAAEADLASKVRKRDKLRADLARAERAFEALQLRAPAAGTVSVMPNFRAGGPFGREQEFREGDRAWAGAAIAELPDLSSIHLSTRLEEADRGRVKPGQTAVVRVDALPDREFRASVDDISVLARVDFGSGWPPQRNFDLELAIPEADKRLRPGMSATARIAIARQPGMLLAPASAVFTVSGRPTVYRLSGRIFEAVPVELAGRDREQVAIARGVSPGDRLALRQPAAADTRNAP